eukprot:287655_1
MVFIGIFSINNPNIIVLIFRMSLQTIEALMGPMMVYLMIERNNDSYHRFICLLYKSNICCCLNCLMKQTIQRITDNEKAISHNLEQKPNENESNKSANEQPPKESYIGSVYETREISTEIKHSNYIHQSQPTPTDNNDIV